MKQNGGAKLAKSDMSTAAPPLMSAEEFFNLRRLLHGSLCDRVMAPLSFLLQGICGEALFRQA
jgi:hypothetical protein